MATMAKFVLSLTAGLTINPDKFLGTKILSAGNMEVNFAKTNGATTGSSLVTLSITDGADGNEQKRVFQAVANSLGGHPRHGSIVEVADVLSSKFIHSDITGIAAVTL
mgnify:CR=1 FL=1